VAFPKGCQRGSRQIAKSEQSVIPGSKEKTRTAWNLDAGLLAMSDESFLVHRMLRAVQAHNGWISEQG